MRSDLMKKGLERAPHRSLLKAMGYTDEEDRPAPSSAWSIPPTKSSPATSIWTRSPRRSRPASAWPAARPWNSAVIGVCDGIAMGHAGMKYSLASRELIADSVEIMATAHPSTPWC